MDQSEGLLSNSSLNGSVSSIRATTSITSFASTSKSKDTCSIYSYWSNCPSVYFPTCLTLCLLISKCAFCCRIHRGQLAIHLSVNPIVCLSINLSTCLLYSPPDPKLQTKRRGSAWRAGWRPATARCCCRRPVCTVCSPRQ